MSDPRLDADIVGKNAEYLTAYYDNSAITYSASSAGGSSKVGLAVTLSGDGTISTAADGEFVLGKLIKVEPNGYCTVQVKGGMELAGGSGATLTLANPIVGAVNGSGAEGYIRIAAHATTTETILARGFIWDNDDTTAVQVYL